uniref:Uncharacterized protein n=1 Tax=Sinocyclocheilus grahami TaxID=75366 RepID=A0A672KBE6_SINGR
MGLSRSSCLLSLYLLVGCLQCKCVCFGRMFGDGMIPLPHIYGARIKGVEVFCPLDPPPPYEAVASNPAAYTGNSSIKYSPCPLTDPLYLYQAQNTEVQMTDLTEVLTESAEAETPSDEEQY